MWKRRLRSEAGGVRPRNWPVSSQEKCMMAIRLKEAMDELRIECRLQYVDGQPVTEYKSHYDFTIRKLKSF